jgi:hypothetical protein
LWHDEIIMDLLGNVIGAGLNNDSCGITELSTEEIEKAIKELKEKKNITAGDKKETLAKLKKMLAQANEPNAGGYVQYYCY